MTGTSYQFDLITLFPEFFFGPLTTGLVGRVVREQGVEVRYINPRQFASDRHRTVDDAPYGGGAGMVMKVGPLAQAIHVARSRGPGPVVMLTPQGQPLNQEDLQRWGRSHHLTLVCGRYEGFDERVRLQVDEEISLGDFVLTGGEYGASTIIDGIVRLLPGTLGNELSAAGDSFADGLLEYPQYTRPETYDQSTVPEVLLSGNHARIRAWRSAMQHRRTRERRPDLLEGVIVAEGEDFESLLSKVEFHLTVGLLSGEEATRVEAVAEAYGVDHGRCVVVDPASGFSTDRFSPDTLRVLVDQRPLAPVIAPKMVRKELQRGRPVSLEIDLPDILVEDRGHELRVMPPPRLWSKASLQGPEKVAVLLDRICGER
ncbi:MAG: tRNA (guanosine(37)-N1)-methyltransferase TrmD [Myxococcales bacterium]|nr:tRNA (guanosine(37)-N1)-methyltransferase TrmD [Myxococcales bacterium]